MSERAAADAPSTAIPAATIILLRDEPQFEALMVERHQGIAFAGGALVFPGGRIEASDHDPAWADHCDGYAQTPAEQRGPRIAAIREAFEEAGILLARKGSALIEPQAVAALHGSRNIVERDDREFLALIQRNELRLTLDLLHFFARWRPGEEVAHRRYDTWFFAAAAPDGQRALADGGEATEIVWTPPADALAARDAGLRKMIFPTVRNVELLGVSDSVAHVAAFAAARPIRLVEPRVEHRENGAFLTIPDDLGYPVTEEALDSAMRL